MPWPGGSVSWSFILHTKRLWIWSLVRASTRGSLLMFLFHIYVSLSLYLYFYLHLYLSLSLTLPPCSLSKINKHILGWGLKTRREQNKCKGLLWSGLKCPIKAVLLNLCSIGSWCSQDSLLVLSLLWSLPVNLIYFCSFD